MIMKQVKSYIGPNILSLQERAKVVNNLLQIRLETLLPAVMRETGFDTWVIICHEDNHDPVFRTLIPWECWAPILQIIVLHDQGPEKGVERLNISRTNMQGLMTSVWDPKSSEHQWACLRRSLEERQPRRIGINQSDVIWAADGLTAALKEKLIATLGPDLASRLESAEPLCIRWLETRIPEELDLYHHAAAIAHAIIKESFSRRVITPGVTTCEDLRWYYWQRTRDLGLDVSFPPFFNRQRSQESRSRWGENDLVIRPGDLVHCDVGIEYLRLLTDHQEMAYVLRPGETESPQGLREGMAQANRLQEIFTGTWQQGLTGNEILGKALTRAREAGLSKPKIYSHSLGHYLHEPGPLMGLPWEQENCPGRGDVVMHYNTCYTVELSVTCPISEWGGQEVSIMLEQDAAFTANGVIFLDGRQTEFHFI
ncbi:aminopeptidase P family protein [Candidatus Poribacteria bacterium]|nr:aminopeptidase P family protein [Candidatus Poribacteria bacterium]